MNMLSFIIILNYLYRHGLASITFDSDDVHLPLLTKTTAQVSTFLCVQRWLTRPILPPPSPANRFKALLPGPPGWADAKRKLLLDFIVLGRTRQSRWRHSIWTNQQSTFINHPIFMPDALPAATRLIYPGLGQAQEYAGLHISVA